MPSNVCRKWVSNPESDLFGQHVLVNYACTHLQEGYCEVWFTSGPRTRTVLPEKWLSDGWPQGTTKGQKGQYNLRRMWINQPLPDEKYNQYHGARVLAEPYHPIETRVWFLSGTVGSITIPERYLSPGWGPQTPPESPSTPQHNGIIVLDENSHRHYKTLCWAILLRSIDIGEATHNGNKVFITWGLNIDEGLTDLVVLHTKYQPAKLVPGDTYELVIPNDVANAILRLDNELREQGLFWAK